MASKQVAGNVAMGVSKFFSGLNENALRYLLPTWMSAFTGVLLRLGFGAIAFWVAGLFMRKKAVKISWRKRMLLFGIGAVFMFGYMSTLLLGLSYTTPISSSIFICLEPVWVFIMCMLFFKERATLYKIIGIVMGLGGAILCIVTQKHSDVATNPGLGNMFCLISSVLYAGYLVVSSRLLKGIDKVTMSKWLFTGGAVVAACVVPIIGFHAPVLTCSLFSTPMLVLLFVLVFPSFVSYLLLDIGLQNLKATVVAIYGYVILIVATVTSYILGQDRFEWIQLLAMLLIVSSVYFVEIAEKRDCKRVVPPTPSPADKK